MRLVFLVAMLSAACSGGNDGAIDAAEPDGFPCGGCDAPTIPDAAETCAALRHEPRPARSIELFEDGRLHAGRSFRVAIGYDATPCDQLAMPTATVDNAAREVRFEPHVFASRAACPGLPIRQTRVMTLRLAAGIWRFTGVSDVGVPPSIHITVGAAPPLPCAIGAGACQQDCDCPDRQRCLGGVGLGGPFLQCALPCELDRDCGGGQCTTVPDGLQLTCDDGLDECGGAGQSCPTGFTCASGSCAPDFVLSSSTRHECACDADCDAPLRCVESDRPDRASRCEIACPTGGGWCQGAHVCGPAASDLSGLAPSDSVCGWLGD